MAIQFPRRGALRTLALAAAFCAGAACSSPKPPAESDAAPPKVERYTAPPEGTSSLVQSVTARREGNGQVDVSGRLLLPAGTRVWVELFSNGAKASDDPIGRAELYLGPSGSFDAGPFDVRGATQCRVQITSHFSRAWQAPEILAVIGLNGTKLPKSALQPNNPSSPSSGGHLDYSSTLTVGA